MISDLVYCLTFYKDNSFIMFYASKSYYVLKNNKIIKTKVPINPCTIMLYNYSQLLVFVMQNHPFFLLEMMSDFVF